MFKFLLCENLNLGTIRCPRNKVQYCIFFISKISNFHVFNVCKKSFITDFSQGFEYVPELSRKEIFFFFLAKVNSILISTKSRPRRLKCGLYNYSYKIKQAQRENTLHKFTIILTALALGPKKHFIWVLLDSYCQLFNVK